MDYVRLGQSGLKVARVCLGTMTFGREADEAMSFKLMDRYVELGAISLTRLMLTLRGHRRRL